jgi:hypothetical protein
MYPSLQRCGVDGKEVILWLVHIQHFITEVAPLVSSDAEVIRYLFDNVSCTSVQPYQWYLGRPMSAQLCLHSVCVCPLLCYEYINTTLRPRTSQCTTLVHVALSLLVYQCICASILLPIYQCFFTSVHLSYITRLSLSVLAPSACQWLHLLYLHPYISMSVHLYICAKATPILSCLISSDSYMVYIAYIANIAFIAYIVYIADIAYIAYIGYLFYTASYSL